MPEGIFSISTASLKELCEQPERFFGNDGRWIEFGIRWKDDEVDEKILVVETDGYYEGSENFQVDGKTYSIGYFCEQDLEMVLKHLKNLDWADGPPTQTALRYYIEFDAFLEPNGFNVGGKWTWGNRSGRLAKREPLDFYEQWRMQ